MPIDLITYLVHKLLKTEHYQIILSFKICNSDCNLGKQRKSL